MKPIPSIFDLLFDIKDEDTLKKHYKSLVRDVKILALLCKQHGISLLED